MRLFRTLPFDPAAPPGRPGAALWFPREFQGEGRHDNPDVYGCIYVSESSVSAVAEALAMFRGAGELMPSMLTRFGLPLSLVELELGDGMPLVDLDDPAVLRRERLRPSLVATRARTATQAQAAALHARHPDAAGLRWWSTLESSWINITLFDRCARSLSVLAIEPLPAAHSAVQSAADFLGLAV